MNDTQKPVGKTSIIILSYNTLEFTKLTLLSLKAHEPKIPYEIIVIDQNSKDGSKEWLEKIKWKNFKYVSLNYNLMFSRGNNLGRFFADPKSKYLMLLNSDVCINEDGWLEERIMPMHRNELIAVTGTAGNCHNYKTGGKFFIDDFVEKHAMFSSLEESREELRNICIKKCVKDDIIQEITAWSSAYNLNMWDELNGLRFDGKYKHMWSDSEYCIRVQTLYGRDIDLQPYNSKMTHYSGLSNDDLKKEGKYDDKVKAILEKLKFYESKISIVEKDVDNCEKIC
jgi:GT2 family glycosyltransferase